MKSYPDEIFDKHLKGFFNHRQDVPAHVQAQIRTRLHTHEETEISHIENNRWVGIMVLCSTVCMLILIWTGWMFFGQAALWVIGAVYYFLTMGGMVVMLLSSHTLRNRVQIHQTGGF